jgi:TonB family protein
MWFLKSALRENHEYLADNGVLNQKANSAVYQTLLLKQTIGLAPITLTSTFNSKIKNRIIMMCKNKSSVLAKFKPLLLVPIVAALFLVFSCTENSIDPAIADTMETKTLANPELIMETDAGQHDSGSVERELFYIVEEMPTFNGGDAAIEFREYIAQNLVYPEIAAINGISGRVIVQFIVDKEGKVVEPTVVRGVSQALDREAVRVIQSSPLWIPGKQSGKEVDVLFTFPINFVIQ